MFVTEMQCKNSNAFRIRRIGTGKRCIAKKCYSVIPVISIFLQVNITNPTS